MSETYHVHISGMTCASCEKMITKMVSKLPDTEVLSISAKDGKMSVRAPVGRADDIRKAVEEAGYKVSNAHTGSNAMGEGCSSCASSSSLDMPNAKEVWDGIMGRSEEWRAERTLLTNAVGSLGVLFLLLAIMYFGLWKNIPNFFATQMPLLELGAVSVVAAVGAGYHFNAYKKPVSCSTGMMEGMTFGMMTGFMIGALLGATNGMFWGSVLGTLIGCAAGVWAGWRSGVMGVMEGLMAGVMAGTMGAMLSVMLLASPLIEFLVLLIGLCVLIYIALAYMQVKELGKLGHKAQVASFFSMLSTCIIFFVLLSVLMIYGPKLGPVWGG